jgi:site-specific recombinase XerC
MSTPQSMTTVGLGGFIHPGARPAQRPACGYALANKGHDTRAIQGWLGHRSITSTAVYTALAPNRFKDFWRD